MRKNQRLSIEFFDKKAFFYGVVLGLFMFNCSSARFSSDQGETQTLTLEVDDADLKRVPGGEIDSAENGASQTEVDETEVNRGDDSDSATAGGSTHKSNKGSSSSHSELKADGKACAQLLNASEQRMKLAGSQQRLSLTSQDAVAARVTGNQNRMEIFLQGKTDAATLKGICVFVAGHANQVNVKVEHSVSEIVLKARGDQALVTIEVAEGASLDNVQWDARGHQPKLTMRGPGNYSCPSGTNVECTKL